MDLLTPRRLSAARLRRYRQVMEVLIRHGFGALLAHLKLEGWLELPRRYFQARKSEPRRLSPAAHLRLALEELGPTFIKLGQALSTRPDVLAPSFITELKRLQEEVPSVPWEEAKRVVEEEFGAPCESRFQTCDPQPIAAASLGQVHGAVLHDGSAVVVKIQRPRINDIIRLDLDILYDLARRLRDRPEVAQLTDPVELVEEFASALAGELDYRREGRNVERFRRNFQEVPTVRVPAVYWDYTTRRVLVMERIRGMRPDDEAAIEAQGVQRRLVARRIAEMTVKSVLEDGLFHADPHPGNLRILNGGTVGVFDLGRVGVLGPEDQDHLVRLVDAAVGLDAGAAADALIGLSQTDPRIDPDALADTARRLLEKYHAIPLEDVHVGELAQELISMAHRHRLRLAARWVLLAHALATAESVVECLDPSLDIFAVARPYAVKLKKQRLSPDSWGPPLLRGSADWMDLWRSFPRQLLRVLQQTGRSQLGVDVRLPDLDRAVTRMDRIANRLSVSLLAAAFIVALGMMLPLVDFTWPWGLVQWVAAVGFAVVSGLGGWLTWTIWRSDRGG